MIVNFQKFIKEIFTPDGEDEFKIKLIDRGKEKVKQCIKQFAEGKIKNVEKISFCLH